MSRRPSTDVPALLHTPLHLDRRARAGGRVMSPTAAPAHRSRHRTTVGLLALALVATACATGGAPGATAPGISPVLRVYNTKANRWVGFEALVREAASADLVFFGEQHDDPVTHAAELALLAGVAAHRPNVVLSLEMFERDVQEPLDAYLQGRTAEAPFLAATRPWERYATDYRAMVELARVRGWPVVASNAPRRLASAVSKAGLQLLDTLAGADRRWLAGEHACPRDDDYFRRFAEQMKDHGSGGPSPASDTAALARMTGLFYEAQCVKDEAMGEAVAAAWRRGGSGAIVVHYDGAFHSDFGQGTAARARRRVPGARALIVSAVPVTSLDSVAVAPHQARADFVIFTKRLATGAGKTVP